MSFAVEVQTAGRGEWVGNLIRFLTREEANKYAADLAARWMTVSNFRVVESKDDVNYYIDPTTNELVRGHPFLPKRYAIVSAYIHNQTDASWKELVKQVRQQVKNERLTGAAK